MYSGLSVNIVLPSSDSFQIHIAISLTLLGVMLFCQFMFLCSLKVLFNATEVANFFQSGKSSMSRYTREKKIQPYWIGRVNSGDMFDLHNTNRDKNPFYSPQLILCLVYIIH